MVRAWQAADLDLEPADLAVIRVPTNINGHVQWLQGISYEDLTSSSWVLTAPGTGSASEVEGVFLARLSAQKERALSAISDRTRT